MSDEGPNTKPVSIPLPFEDAIRAALETPAEEPAVRQAAVKDRRKALKKAKLAPKR